MLRMFVQRLRFQPIEKPSARNTVPVPEIVASLVPFVTFMMVRRSCPPWTTCESFVPPVWMKRPSPFCPM